MYPPGEMDEWVDGPEDSPEGSGRTALYPKCGIDAVRPDNIEVKLNKWVLLQIAMEIIMNSPNPTQLGISNIP